MSISNLLSGNNYKIYSNDIITSETLNQTYTGTIQNNVMGTVNFIKDGHNVSLTFNETAFVTTGGTALTTTLDPDYRPVYDIMKPIVVDNIGTVGTGSITLTSAGILTIYNALGANFGVGNCSFKTFSLNFYK
jgi:hypothetical protein